MEILFFASIVGYFAATVLQAAGVTLRKDVLCRVARIIFALSFALHTGFTIWRGVAAGRIPLANQFEFASGFAWPAAILGLILYSRMKQEWILTASMPVAFLVLSYAAGPIANTLAELIYFGNQSDYAASLEPPPRLLVLGCMVVAHVLVMIPATVVFERIGARAYRRERAALIEEARRLQEETASDTTE